VLGGVLSGVGAMVAGVRSASAAGPATVTICHRTGNPNVPYKLITVPEPALATHLEHGDFEAFDCDGTWSCEECLPPCLPLFCNSAELCPTGATEFCPGGPLDPTSSDQAMAACEACFGVGVCVHNDLDCSGAGWLEDFAPESEPPAGSPVFGYEIGLCDADNPQPPGRVFFGTASDPTYDYGYWGTDNCPPDE
jgi:hypothetical protein